MARDKIHDSIKNALIHDGWHITHDPYLLKYEDVSVEVDLAAEKLFAAEKDEQKIAVEIKSFLSRSGIYDFERALGQYILYRIYLEEVDPHRVLYLAVSSFTYSELFLRKGIQLAVKKGRLKLIVVDLKQEEILQWVHS
ncbi:MAG: hypothetical protein F6K62_26905 [Sphaerospermopsis sp. SIO1G2]|nr:hypothetical protein [Sphaerospermopsis sp. SIO1G2]